MGFVVFGLFMQEFKCFVTPIWKQAYLNENLDFTLKLLEIKETSRINIPITNKDFTDNEKNYSFNGNGNSPSVQQLYKG